MKTCRYLRCPWSILTIAFFVVFLTACNLGREQRQAEALRISPLPDTRPEPADLHATSVPLVRTAAPASPASAPTNVPILFTPIVARATALDFTAPTSLPAQIYISAPTPNTVLSGNTPILGAAFHPQFLHYRLEYASASNPRCQWYPLIAESHRPIVDNVLGYLNSQAVGLADGAYQLRLRVTLLDGSEQTAIVSPIIVRNQIQIQPTAAPTTHALPSSVFSASPDEGYAPLSVVFVGPVDANVSSFSWRFGDGNSSSQASPTHIFTEPGAYTVNLSVSGPHGGSSFARLISVHARQPSVAAFDASPLAGAPPVRVQFSNRSSGDIAAFIWRFGDGNENRTDSNPAHTYVAAGQYFAELTVSGPAGESSAVKQITVAVEQRAAPIASFDLSVNQGMAPLPLQLTNTSTGEIDSVLWELNGESLPADAAGDAATVLTAAGEYAIRLTVAGPGGIDSLAQTVVVSAPAPVADFSAAPMSGSAPLTVQFTNHSLNADRGYAWDFDSDGAVDAVESSPSHVYETPGLYLAQLTATGEGGVSQSSIEIVVVAPAPAPVAGFTASASDLVVTFVSTASGESLNFSWDFGDGSNSTDVNPIHTYDVPGAYMVVQQTSNSGGSATHSQEVQVSAAPTDTPPSAGELAFVSNRDGNNEIYLMNSDGAGAVNLTNHPSNDRHPSWSPDGQKLAFASRRDNDAFDIYILDPATSAETRLTTAASDNRPAWSSDGARIAFVSERAGNKDIWIMDVDGSQQTQLTSSPANEDQPTWSPDSASVAYVTDADGPRHIAVANIADGSVINTIRSDAGENFLPAWLNDANRSRLLFTSTRFDDEDIFVVDPLNGEGLLQITSDASIERQPNWSGNGDLILFVSDRAGDGSRDIYTVAVDGSTIKRLTQDSGNNREPKWR